MEGPLLAELGVRDLGWGGFGLGFREDGRGGARS